MMIYLICTARTCTEDEEAAAEREKAQSDKLIEEIEILFTSDTLTDHLLSGYETTATDKLNDFADYLKIISDTTLDAQFRQHAAELAGNLFIPGAIELRGWSKTFCVQEINTLEDLIQANLSEGTSSRINPVRINVNDQFVRENDSTFTGTLSFYQEYFSPSDTDQTEDLSGPYIMDIYLNRKIKNFGTNQLVVWEVYLGDIE
jgi:hypothetical protein